MMMARRLAIHPWPAGIILFFLSLFAFETFLIITAVQSRPTLVEESPYTKALSYDETRQKLVRAKDLQLEVEVLVAKKGKGDERGVTLRFSSLPHKKLSTVSLGVRRADTDLLDQQMLLTALDTAPNDYVGTIHLPKTGLWLFEIEVLVDGQPGLLRKQIQVH